MHNGNGAAQRKALLAGAIGNFVEWYDFALYGYFATTIAAVFFPKSDPTAALLATFAVFAVGFVARPLGGVVFGHLGDRIGRRAVLLLSVGLMSVGTVAIGLLPGYAQIGVAAPILLLTCRLVQGFAAGGEFTGAAIFVIEHAPVSKRGRYASVGYIFVFLAYASAALVSAAMTSTTTAEQLMSWGWRVPFLLAAPLALVGLYLRLRVEDSPVFTALQSEGELESAPLLQAFKTAKKPMLILIGWSMAPAVTGYLISAFMPSYLTKVAGLNNTQSLMLVATAYLVAPIGCFLGGYAIDVVGRKRVAVASALCTAAAAIPVFLLLEHSSLVVSIGALIVFVLLYSAIPTTMTLAVVELFPARVRSSASALSYNICFVVFGGSAPYVATGFVTSGYPLAPSYYITALCTMAAIVAAIGIGNRPNGGVRQTVAPSTDAKSQQPA